MMRIEKLDSYERVPVSDATRTLLCDFAAGDLKRPLRDVDVDWEEVFRGVCRNGLLGLTRRYLVHWEQEPHPPLEFRRWVAQVHRTNAIRMVLMYREIAKVLAQVAGSELDCVVVKGPALAYTIYPDPFLRSFNDLDLVVRERDWAAVHRLLAEMGFRPEKDLSQPPPKLVAQGVLYELKYWHAETGLLVEVHYDDLLNAGLASRDVEGYWQRAVPVDIDGVSVKVLSLEDQLIHLCAHAHYHGYTRLNWFSDMAFIVREHAAQLDWERLLETVRVEEAQVGVYYSLHYLSQLLGVSVPEGVLGALRPDCLRRWLHERYLPQEKVLSLQPMSRPAFSFYFIPLLKRLLPDLLVMGRRGDKLRYLLRLLVPPRAWLRHYYRLGDTQTVTIHYLLHPLKLLYHYLAEVKAALVNLSDLAQANDGLVHAAKDLVCGSLKH